MNWLGCEGLRFVQTLNDEEQAKCKTSSELLGVLSDKFKPTHNEIKLGVLGDKFKPKHNEIKLS